MRISVLSGKGGAGKTMVAVNLAVTAENAVYVDCDVEEPNGRLFLKPENVRCSDVCALLPEFDAEKCTGCRKCVDFCRFNALIYVKNKPMVFPEVCHSCGGCLMVCKNGAITEKAHTTGHIEQGMSGKVNVITGVLNIGEASGVGVIKAAQKMALSHDGTVIFDCPPGSACSVKESIENADYCILVAEPTAFGFHNFCMVHELVGIMKKPCGVVINKHDLPYAELENYCAANHLPVLARIPYRKEFASMIAQGKTVCGENKEMKEVFAGILREIEGVSV